MPVTSNPKSITKENFYAGITQLLLGIGRDVANILWNDFGRPYLSAKLNQLTEKLLSSSRTENVSEYSHSNNTSQADSIIDVEEDALTPADNFSEKIIPFPTDRVG